MKHANLLLLNLALAARALAGDLNPALISEWPGGWVSDPAVRGTYAYLSSGGSGCQILDVSNPAAPRRVGFSAIRISGSTQFSGNHAYVPSGAAGLQVIDLSDPTNPRRVGGFDTGGSVSDVAIAGNYAYVVGDSLIVINISEPTHPVQVGSSSLRAYAVSVEVSGNNAFVIGSTHLPGQGDQWTLDSFDISDPAKPQPVGHLQRPGKPTSMAHSAQFVYVSADRYDLNIGGVQVINVSDPANPQWVAGDSNNRTTDRLAVAGNYLYLTKVSTDNRGALDIFDISTPASIRKVGTYFGSEVGGLDVSGNQAYISNTGHLEVIDIANPVSPRRIGSWIPPIGPMDVANSGNFTYLIGPLGLTTYLNILDTSNPSNPKSLGSLAVGGWTVRLELLGHYAYITTQSALHVVDVTDPKAPKRTGGITAQHAFNDVAFAGDYAFLADREAGLQLLTITNRASPRRLATFFASSLNEVRGVCVSSNIAVVLKQSWQGPSDSWYGTVSVVDITNPQAPIELSSYQTEGVLNRGAVSGSHVFLTKRYVQNADRRWWAGMLEILDISDPGNPQLVSRYETTAEAYTVTVSGGRAYVGCGASQGTDGPWPDGQNKTGGLIVVDVSEPTHPRRVGGFQGHSVEAISVEGDRAYLGGGFYGALRIIDLGGSAALSRIADVDTPDLACGLALNGNQLVVADRLAGVEVVDVSNPVNPKLTTTIASAELVHGVAVSGAIVYAASDKAGVRSFDLTNPANPQALGVCDTPGTARGITLSDPYAYVADGDAGLQILDVSNPANMQPVASVDTTGFANAVALMGNHALVADWDRGLVVVDVSNLQTPQIVGNYRTGGYVLSVAVAGSSAFVADGVAGFQVLDLSKPDAPKLLGGAPSEGWTRSIAVSGRFAYVADAFAGVQSYDISDLSHPRRMGGTSAVDPYGIVVIGERVLVAGGRDGLAVLELFSPPLNVLASPTQTPGNIDLRVDGPAGASVRLQRSTDLINWQDWQPVTLGYLPTPISDAIGTGSSQRFYRAVKP